MSAAPSLVPIICRALVPVPGKVHTVRCSNFAARHGLCGFHILDSLPVLVSKPKELT